MSSRLSVPPDPTPQLWLTFAPVADQSAQYLRVPLEEVNWLSLVYMVVAIPLCFITTWMLDTLGLRITVPASRRTVSKCLTFNPWRLSAAGSGLLVEHAGSRCALLRRVGSGAAWRPFLRGDGRAGVRCSGSAARHPRPHQDGSALVPRPSARHGQHHRLHV